MRVLLLAACVLLLAGPAVADNWYVDDDAAGGGDGSFLTPFQTIQAGVTAAVSAGDSVLVLPGTYAEHVVIGAGDDLIISGNSGVAADVVWQTTGETIGASAECLLQTQTGTEVHVEDLTMQKGAAFDQNQGGWTITTNGGVHGAKNVTFDGLSTCFWMNDASTNGVMTATNCRFINPATDYATNGAAWAIGPYDATLTVDGCYFDVRGLTGESTSFDAAILHMGTSTNPVIIRNSTWLADSKDQYPFYYNRSKATGGLLIEGCSFSGGNDGVNDGVIKLGHTITAASNMETVIIRNNVFANYGHAAIRSVRPDATDGHELNKEVAIVGNKFYGDGSTTDNAVKLTGITGGSVENNLFTGGATVSGVSLLSCRNISVSGNQIEDCDNGVVITANGVLNGTINIHSNAVQITGNWFNRGGGDGAIKIDNYSGGVVRNDSLLTVMGNVFTNVTYVARWVNTSDVTNTMTTLADYQNTSTGWPSESTIDRGNTVGSTDDVAAGRLSGIVPPYRKVGAW